MFCIQLIVFALFISTTSHVAIPEANNDIDFEVFQFPEANPVQWDGYEVFGPHTTYLRARQEIRQHFKSTIPAELSQCTPVYLYFLSRHAIRYPLKSELASFHKSLPKLQKQILSGANLSAAVAHELKNWQLLIHPTEYERVTMAGKLETSVMARIFYKHFPTLLDIDSTDFEVRHTKYIRTKETAEAFARSLVEFQILRNGTTYRQSLALVNQLVKQKFPMLKRDDILLSTFKLNGTGKWLTNQRKTNATDPNWQGIFKQLVRQFGKRNGKVTLATIRKMRNICAYEVAYYRSSVWCELFTKQELALLELAQDLRVQQKSHQIQYRSSNVLVEDLSLQLKSIAERPPLPGRTKATLNFAHDALFIRLLGFFGLFAKVPEYQLDKNRLVIPLDRQWRTGELLPFGANFAFALYKCQDQHKLLTLFNEVPIKLCRTELCDLDEFLSKYPVSSEVQSCSALQSHSEESSFNKCTA